MKNKSAGHAPVILRLGAVNRKMRCDPIESDQPGGNFAAKL
jgi:hypothetical protein